MEEFMNQQKIKEAFDYSETMLKNIQDHHPNNEVWQKYIKAEIEAIENLKKRLMLFYSISLL